MRHREPAPRRSAALVALVVVAACSGGGDGGDGDDGASLGQTSSTQAPEAPAVPPESDAGTGVVVVGGVGATFAVTACSLEPVDGPTGAAELLRVTGEGTRGNGVPFAIEVVRAASGDEDETFTDLITYSDTARILQVQRSEVAGEVTDLRDPSARGTLLRVRPEGLSASGIAGPPGTSAPAGPGLVGLALDLTCDA